MKNNIKAKTTSSMFLLVSMVLLSATLLLPMCQALTVGVSVGNWFKYKGTLVSWVADPGVPFPPSQYDTDVLTFNTSDWFRYTVTGIVAENVTFEVVTHWKNGTETTETLGDNMADSFSMMIIGANLAPGAQIRPAYDWEPVFGFPWIWPARILNATTEDPYTVGTRTANVLDWWMPPVFGGDPTTRQIYHWDKLTGIQTLFETHSAQTAYDDSFQPIGDYSYVTKRVLVDSSISGMVVPEGLTIGVMMLLSTIAVLVTTRYFRKRPKNENFSLVKL